MPRRVPALLCLCLLIASGPTLAQTTQEPTAQEATSSDASAASAVAPVDGRLSSVFKPGWSWSRLSDAQKGAFTGHILFYVGLAGVLVWAFRRKKKKKEK